MNTIASRRAEGSPPRDAGRAPFVRRRGVHALALLAFAGVVVPGCAPERTSETSSTDEADEPFDGARLAAREIVGAARKGSLALERLSELCDGIGARPAGSDALEQALAWSVETMRDDGADRVALDRVDVSVWERGEESLTLLSPGPPRSLPILGLGNSVGTPEGGISGPLLVVGDFDELEAAGDAARGKIVLFDYPMKSQANMFAAYGDAVRYRSRGAAAASEQGAVAALVRSVTTRSMRTPHTGAMGGFAPEIRPIPAASVATEDASMLRRLAAKGDVTLRLEMGARSLPDRPSANAVGELTGRELPDEVVVIGAHIDSWDVGTGAHDDGTGVVMAIEALRILRELDLRPRRTVRAVLFTNEERGLDGARAYLAAHESDLDKHVAAIESDTGGFAPTGFGFQGSEDALVQIERLMPLFEEIGPLVTRPGGSGADIGPIVARGVPGFGLRVESTHYFDYHHTEADTFDKVDPDEFKDALATFTLMTWLLAEMPEPLPRAGSR